MMPDSPFTDSLSAEDLFVHNPGPYDCSKPVYTKGLLSRPVIREYLEKGYVTIDPFEEENLGTNSYDIRLGKWFYRERSSSTLPTVHWPTKSPTVLYNMYQKSHVEKIYEKCEAQPASSTLYSWFDSKDLEGISPDDLVFLIKPGESVLAHTEEFIGSSCDFVTCTMAARSTIGRNALEVTRCSGVGDIHYCNRWTLELTNNLQYHTIPLVAGRRVGQVLFYDVVPLDKDDPDYVSKGKYQTSRDLEELKRTWKPEDMLPKAYLDREINSKK